MNWFNLIGLCMAMSQNIVQSVEVIASHKAADGSPMTSAQKAAAGVQLGNMGLMIAGAATGQIPQTQVNALIQAINDGTVAQNNAQAAANAQAATPPVAPQASVPPVAPLGGPFAVPTVGTAKVS